ncbi:MAG TPA: TOMM precursor leader peptide-binding protein [Longimicrobiales bacterium]|nr:TOMM precursor leader peptide-binding protein [Longimicrobiales bacterium]
MRAEPRLRLDPRFTHLVTTGRMVILVGDEDPLVVEDPRARDVLPLLNGHRTALDIAERLVECHPPEVVHFILLQLLHGGVAVEVAAPPRLLDSDGGGTADGLAEALRSAWEGRGERPWVDVPPDVWHGPRGCRLRLVDDYMREGLGDGGPPLLLAGLGARRIWLGPVLGPGASCPACLQDRLRLNLTGHALLHDAGAADAAGGEIVPLPAEVPAAAWALLAGQLRDRAGELEELERALLVFPLEGGAIAARGGPGAEPERHPVPRLPHCPRCGDPTLTIPGADVELQFRPHSGHSGGGYRIVPPAETWARHAHLVSPLTGVVRRIREVPVAGTDLMHVYTASHAHHYGRGGVRAVKDGRRDHSGGKGRTDADARASALCESLERFSSVHRGDEPFRVARRSELDDEAVAPCDLLHFSERQYAGRAEWNRSQKGGFQTVPEPYLDEAIAWSPVRSLATRAVRLVPSAFLYYGFHGPGDRFCDGDSNGLAGGNCLEEAILQGLLEVAERDAVALWWYNRAPRPGVDLASARDPWIAGVAAHYDSLGRDVWALDLTTDLGIPTYAALSALRREREQDVIFGFGAHLDAGIALTRAFTELNQMLPTVLETREARRRRLLPEFTEAVRWWDEATVESEPYLVPAPRTPRVAIPPTPAGPAGDLRDDILACVARAAAVGCDVLVHDMTRPDVGFPVAKVIVPGLRHFWRRLGPGRLYDVPAALGWLPRRLEEAEVNPVSLFV